MEPLGPKLAEGRDSEIYEHGPGRVLRRARDGRSLAAEAEVMAHAAAHGYPVPRVDDAGDGWLVMERIDGVDLLDAIARTPAGLRRAGDLLADLHLQLGAIPALDTMRPAPGPAGDRLVHLDLHPLNVLVTDDGPVVIDWANARRGVPAIDVANTWALVVAGTVPGGAVDRAVAAIGRKVLLRSFLARVDREAARRLLPALVEWRSADRNHTAAERARLQRLAGSQASRVGR